MAPGLINFNVQETSFHCKESVIVIIDYQAGNLTSVVRSLKALGVEGTVTQDPAVVAQASRVIFPGVGAAGKAMATLRELGLDQALRESLARRIPILGICLGAQIILEHSEENDTACLGLLPGRTRALPRGEGLKIPHMGWNRVRFLSDHPVFKGLPEGAEYYFVHGLLSRPSRIGPGAGGYGPRHRVSQRHRSAQSSGHPVSSGEKRPFRTTDPREFPGLGRLLC